MTKPLVALVGRPNVGKSTLFNRLIGQRVAIVEDLPGTTRDRIYGDTEWNGVAFTLVDTGGLIPDAPEDDITGHVRQHAQLAIAEADVVVLLTDAKEGLTAIDEHIAQILRRSHKPILLAVSKADNRERRLAAVEFYALGLGQPMAISALHGTGTGDLLDEIVAAFPLQEEEEETEATKVAIVGRPNVGKSSLLNAILGQERAIVHEAPGTTRDALDTTVEWGGQPIVLIDTAGIRRRGKIVPGVERYSVLRALKAIARADVALLLMDAVEGPTAQDAHVAGYVVEEAKGLVLVVNKWDLIEKDAHTMQQYTERVRQVFKFAPYASTLFISAKTRQRVDQVLTTALQVREQRQKRVPTGELNRMLQDVVARHAPPSKGRRRLHFYYATQPTVDPPTIIFWVNHPRLVHFSYKRYLENRLREWFGFEGTPIRLSFRKRE